MAETNVAIKKIEPQMVLSIRDVLPDFLAMKNLFGPLFSTAFKKFMRISGPPIVIYHDQFLRDRNFDVEATVPVKAKPRQIGKFKVYELPEIKQAACLIYKGPYALIGRGHIELMDWIERNGYKPVSPCREVYKKGQGIVFKGNPLEYITEIQQPVTKV